MSTANVSNTAANDSASAASANANAFDINAWATQTKSSLYVKRIPRWATKDSLVQCFGFLGYINHIDIVDVQSGNGRMAFIYFDYWYDTKESEATRNMILNDAEHTSFISDFDPEVGHEFRMFITYNRRTIPRSTYTVDQLTDMVNTLNAKNAALAETVNNLIQYINENINPRLSAVENASASQAEHILKYGIQE